MSLRLHIAGDQLSTARFGVVGPVHPHVDTGTKRQWIVFRCPENAGNTVTNICNTAARDLIQTPAFCSRE
jgi:hypothetical protein